MTPLMKKNPLYDCTTGGGFAMLQPQARDHPATWKSKNLWSCRHLWPNKESHPKKKRPLIPWFLGGPPPKKMSTKLLHQILQSTNWTKKNRVKRSLFPVSTLRVSQVFLLVLPFLKLTSYHIPLKNILFQVEISSSNHWSSGCELLVFGEGRWFQPKIYTSYRWITHQFMYIPT